MRWQSRVPASLVLLVGAALLAGGLALAAEFSARARAESHELAANGSLNELSEGDWLASRRRRAGQLVLSLEDGAEGDWLSARRRRALG